MSFQNVFSREARIEPGAIIDQSVVLEQPTIKGTVQLHKAIVSGHQANYSVSQI